MPTYEYECIEHGHRFEEFQSMTEEPLDRCPICGGPARRRISAGAGILFKGSGFYETDYRSSSYKKAAEAEKSAGSGKKEKEAAAKESAAKESATRTSAGGEG